MEKIFDSRYENVHANMRVGDNAVLIVATIPGTVGVNVFTTKEGMTRLSLSVYDRQTLAGLAVVCTEGTEAIDGLTADGIELLPDA